MSDEMWRLIPSLSGLLASSHGRLMVSPYEAPIHHGGRRQYGGAPTAGQWDGDRYIYVFRGRTYKVARLVCEAFNGLPAHGQVCMHKDENSRNNVPSNLKWGSQKENLNAPGFLRYCTERTGDRNPYRKGKARKAA